MTERPAPSVPPGDTPTNQPTINPELNPASNLPVMNSLSNSSSASSNSSSGAPTPSLSQLKQQIVRELLILHQCYSRLNQAQGEPHRFMSFVHSLFALLPPELQLTEAEALAVDEYVSPNASPYTPVASRSFMNNLPIVDLARCPELSSEDCPVCQEPFSVQSSLTQPRTASPMVHSISQQTIESRQPTVDTKTGPPADVTRCVSTSADPRVIELPCEHIFHYPCVAAWMATHNTCPCCRFKLPTDNTLYNETVIRRQPEPVRRNRSLKRKASEIECARDSPLPTKRQHCGPVSRCALSTHGLPCLLPVRSHQTNLVSAALLPDAVEHLSCGHSFHSQCLRTALALLSVATLQPDIGPCPLCCLHSASPDSTARLQRMTLHPSSLPSTSSRPTSPVEYRVSPSVARYARTQH